MMGSSGDSSAFGNFNDLIALLDDKERYQGKVHELDKRVAEANAVHEKVVDNVRKAEDTRKMADELVAEAGKKLIEANYVKRENERLDADLKSRERSLYEAQQVLSNDRQQFEQAKHAYLDKMAVEEQTLVDRKAAAQAEADLIIKRRGEAALEAEQVRQFAQRDAEGIRSKAHDEHAQAAAARAEAERVTAAIQKKHKDLEDFLSHNKG